MNINVYIKYEFALGTHDISDYITEDISVPFVTRERDYSLVTRGFDLVLPFTFPFPEGEGWETISEVYLNTDNLYFSGYVVKRSENYNNRTYTFTVFNKLELLKNFKVDYSTLHTSLSATSDLLKYNPSDFNGKISVSLLHVIEIMFQVAGLVSPVTTISNTLVMPFKRIARDDGWFDDYTNIYFNELKIDERMLYAIGQMVARKAPTTPAEIEDSNWNFDSTPTFFDFISWICSMFGLVLKGSAGGDYILQFLADETYSISDDETYSYDKETFAKDKNIYWQIFAALRSNYYGTVDTSLTNNYYQTVYDSTSEWYNNLLITIVDRYWNSHLTYKGTMLQPAQYLDGLETVRNYITPDDVLSVPTGALVGNRVKKAYEYGYTKFTRKTKVYDDWKNVYKHDLLIEDLMSEITLII